MIGPQIGSVIGTGAGMGIGIGIPAGGTVTPTMTATIADSADPLFASDSYSYTVQVTATSSPTVTSISAVVTLDASVTYVSSSGTGWTIGRSGQTVTCTLASLAGNTAANPITINVTAPGSNGTYTTSLAVTSANAATVNASETTQVTTITTDGPTPVWRPATQAEWQAALSTFGADMAPDFFFQFQEASGALVDAAHGATLPANGSGSYQQAGPTGWTSKCLSTADNVSGQGWSQGNPSMITGIGLAEPATQSCVYLLYFTTTIPTTSGSTLLMAAGTGNRIDVMNTGVLRVAPGSVSGTFNYNDSNMHALCLELSPSSSVPEYSGSGTVRWTTEKEQKTATWSAPASGNRGIGACGTTQKSPPARYNMLAIWTGSAADKIIASAHGGKDLISRLKWTMAF
jgi:hypothetical protein